MARLNQLEKSLCNNLITKREQISLKGKGVGNFYTKEGKNCPPPIEEGRIQDPLS